jgi:nucleotide-binding universal stress UspA family protein
MARAVMVAVDGSEGSRAALRWGAGLAAATGSPLTAVRAWRYPATAGINPITPSLPSADEVDAQMEEELRKLLVEELGPAGDEASIRVARGDAAGAILDVGAQEDVAVLVVGSRGLGGFKALMLGSVGRTVVENATMPVAVVRDPQPISGGDGTPILVGVDGSAASERAIDWAAWAAAAVGAPVLLIHAIDPGRPELPGNLNALLRKEGAAYLENARAPFEAAGVEVDSALVDGDPRIVLMDAAERERARMVVAGTRGQGRVSAVMVGSVASYLANRIPGVLVVTPP